MRILAVFAHPDDELGCVGTLAKHARRGDEVMLAWTTHGELASQYVDQSDEEVRCIRREHGAWVAEKLGGESHFFDMGDSRMTGSREEALQLARLYARFRPDVVITWSDDNPHPDHRMTAKITFDAVTLARIPKILNDGGGDFEPHRERVRFLQYPTMGSPRPFMHVDIGEEIDLSTELFRFYQEFYNWNFSAEQFLASKASFGRESGVKYAEKFQRRSSYAPALSYLN